MIREFVECKDRRTAYRRCLWASIVAKVVGGYIAFESMEDYHTWKNQK